MKITKRMFLGCAVVGLIGTTQSFASLTTFQTYSGADYGVSTAGWGSVVSSSGMILTSVPVGATLVAAYLYTGYNNPSAPETATLNGTAVNFGPMVNNTTACCGIGSERADVTSIIQSALTAAGGPSATPLSLSITEGNTAQQDGEELVSVYKYATGPDTSVAILDGFASVLGDVATLNLGAPVTGTTTAEMMIGDNFSCCGQESTITVNGTVITNTAGNDDDCVDANPDFNGCLITVGTDLNNGGTGSDPFSPLLPTYAQDHERYNLTPELTLGGTTITVDTINASENDNIFAAVFQVSGDVTSVTVGAPEPSTFMMFGGALVGLGAIAFRQRRRVN
jgi:hypothetical protein